VVTDSSLTGNVNGEVVSPIPLKIASL